MIRRVVLTHRLRLLAASALLVPFSLGLAGGTQAQPRPTRPNIVLIQADDLGWGDLGAYGQRRFRTPHLDRLAKQGLRFVQYYSGSTVCAPSRAALMTGLHTGHGRVRGNGDIPLADEDVTIAEVLRPAGYRTAVIGKWGLGDSDTEGRPDRQGFDEAFGFLRHPHAHRQTVDRLWKNGAWVDVPPDTLVNTQFTEAALDFIDRSRTAPFFLYLAYTTPHAEIRSPAPFEARFRARFRETPFVNAKADAQPRPVPPYDRSAGYRSQPTPRAAFAGMVTALDADVGRIVDRLRARGLDRRTLVLFTSDNGPHREGGADPEFFDSNGPLRGIKRDLYEGGVRVPMIAWWPGTVPTGVRETIWAHWDLLPTLAAIAGAKGPNGVDGESMAAALTSKIAPPGRERTLYWEFHERGFQQAARRGPWKAVRLGPGRPIELYNLESDEHERTNVAAGHPRVVETFEEYFAQARTPSTLWPGGPSATVPRD